MMTSDCAVRAVVLKGDKLLVIKRDNLGKKYITLPGGSIEQGETPEQAVVRELKEETGFDMEVIRKVFKVPPSDTYPGQMVYLCQTDSSGQPKLADNAIETRLAKQGNIYHPVFMTITEIEQSKEPFITKNLFKKIKQSVKSGFAGDVQTINLL